MMEEKTNISDANVPIEHHHAVYEGKMRLRRCPLCATTHARRCAPTPGPSPAEDHMPGASQRNSVSRAMSKPVARNVVCRTTT